MSAPREKDGKYYCTECKARTGYLWDDKPEEGGTYLVWKCKNCGYSGRLLFLYEEFATP